MTAEQKEMIAEVRYHKLKKCTHIKRIAKLEPVAILPAKIYLIIRMYLKIISFTFCTN